MGKLTHKTQTVGRFESVDVPLGEAIFLAYKENEERKDCIVKEKRRFANKPPYEQRRR